MKTHTTARPGFFIWSLLVALSSAPGLVLAQSAAQRCQALVGNHAILDAATEVTHAQLVGATADLPAFCDLQGIVKPDIGFELRLPVERWNQKFFELGRGGFCRAITMEECDTPLRKGYSCAITDHGHKTMGSDDIWYHDNLQARVDCGFRATHVTAVVGKVLTEKFYQQQPLHSYYMGCSTGGRLGLVEAEKFPWDFDGIIAGAAPITKSSAGLGLTWNALAPLDTNGKALLSVADVRLLAAAVVAQCDRDDGVADGVVGAPLQCHFDPASLQCRAGQSSSCLSAPQVAAVRKMYGGPVTSKGVKLYSGTLLPGSELNWIDTYVSQGGEPSIIFGSMNDMFRNINNPGRGDGWNIRQFNWDEDYKQVGIMEALNSGSNPDLRAFKATGGKLLVYHGLADELVTPGNMIDFYQTVQRTMGGSAATTDFMRLFMVPGLNHCSGGTGATVIDYIAALEAWVEQGTAPDKLIGAHLKPAAPAGAARHLPIDAANTLFTRPHYAYPMRAQYAGTGDPNSASSFRPVPATAAK
jgi:feruloyl esterase